jgi:phytoene dehydrogenase-like protein
MINPDAATGHLLRDPRRIPEPAGPVQEADVVIVGGGISGLSALRHLRKSGQPDVVLLELEAESGGNSVSGKNTHSAYPWAAHYLPVPDPQNTELLRFLEECGVITGYRNELPLYNEYYLCSDPEERLFINGYWQEGLVPSNGLTPSERAETARFFKYIEELRAAKGADGKAAFCIPLGNASNDAVFRELDESSFAAWLDRNDYRSKPLRWYLDYCCLDDYGLKAAKVSAWAGLHYFAGRKGRAANATHSDLLTWPEGNAFLMRALRKPAVDAIRTKSLVFKIEQSADSRGFMLSVYDAARRQSYRIRSRELILATPDFINRHLLGASFQTAAPAIAHTPWLVANLTLKQLPQSAGQGQQLCWDNVQYGSESVGYVNARQQQPGIKTGSEVITYYKPLVSAEPRLARQQAQQRDWKSWLLEIVEELGKAHPGIAAQITGAEIRVWGHGMPGPLPGFLAANAARALAPLPFELAHTDYCGISIFEEAFYQGLHAAEAILKRL